MNTGIHHPIGAGVCPSIVPLLHILEIRVSHHSKALLLQSGVKIIPYKHVFAVGVVDITESPHLANPSQELAVCLQSHASLNMQSVSAHALLNPVQNGWMVFRHLFSFRRPSREAARKTRLKLTHVHVAFASFPAGNPVFLRRSFPYFQEGVFPHTWNLQRKGFRSSVSQRIQSEVLKR